MVDRVLVVEDQLDIAELININLLELSLSVELTSTGEQAMNLLAEQHYDLVILDIMLPGISGLDVAENYENNNQAKPF